MFIITIKNARIPTQYHYDIVRKIKKLNENGQFLDKKNCNTTIY